MRRRTFSSSSSVYSWVRSTASAAGLVLAATFPASKHVCQIIYEILKPHSETGFVVSRMSMSIPTCKDPQIFPKNIMSYASRWVAQPSVKGQRFSRPRRTSSLGVLPADYNFFVDFKCLGGWNFGQIQQMALVPFVPAIRVHSSTGMCSHIHRSVTREWSIVTQFYQCGLHMI